MVSGCWEPEASAGLEQFHARIENQGDDEHECETPIHQHRQSGGSSEQAVRVADVAKNQPVEKGGDDGADRN